MDIHSIVLDIVTFNMSNIVHQNNYVSIKIDDPKVEGLYVVHFTSTAYTLQD